MVGIVHFYLPVARMAPLTLLDVTCRDKIKCNVTHHTNPEANL